MTILTPQEIVDTCKEAGFTGESLAIAASIALAESGGNTNARNSNGPTSGCPNGSTDRGLFQINNCYHPEVSDLCADSPICSAMKAYIISENGTNFHPWSTYTNGAYKNHLQTVEPYVNEPQQTMVTDTQATTDIQTVQNDVQKRLTEVEAFIEQHKTPQSTGNVPRHYHVHSGDTLWAIAQRFYGNGNDWEKVYNANKSIIGPSANVLKAGEVLVIP